MADDPLGLRKRQGKRKIVLKFKHLRRRTVVKCLITECQRPYDGSFADMLQRINSSGP